LVDSSHGGSYGKDEGMKPLAQQYKFFGELEFPVPETEAWKEKVISFTVLQV
jgi:callose synthase